MKDRACIVSGLLSHIGRSCDSCAYRESGSDCLDTLLADAKERIVRDGQLLEKVRAVMRRMEEGDGNGKAIQ